MVTKRESQSWEKEMDWRLFKNWAGMAMLACGAAKINSSICSREATKMSPKGIEMWGMERNRGRRGWTSIFLVEMKQIGEREGRSQ